jgi:hypothetical protein
VGLDCSAFIALFLSFKQDFSYTQQIEHAVIPRPCELEGAARYSHRLCLACSLESLKNCQQREACPVGGLGIDVLSVTNFIQRVFAKSEFRGGPDASSNERGIRIHSLSRANDTSSLQHSYLDLTIDPDLAAEPSPSPFAEPVDSILRYALHSPLWSVPGLAIH